MNQNEQDEQLAAETIVGILRRFLNFHYKENPFRKKETNEKDIFDFLDFANIKLPFIYNRDAYEVAKDNGITPDMMCELEDVIKSMQEYHSIKSAEQAKEIERLRSELKEKNDIILSKYFSEQELISEFDGLTKELQEVRDKAYKCYRSLYDLDRLINNEEPCSIELENVIKNNSKETLSNYKY